MSNHTQFPNDETAMPDLLDVKQSIVMIASEIKDE
jgi:hypothetical protein